MNIFTTFKQTPYKLVDRDASANSWDTWSDAPDPSDGKTYMGVFKPRDSSNIYDESPQETGDATLNVKPGEDFIDPDNPAGMIGDAVYTTLTSGEPAAYTVIGYDTAMNYRTGKVEHYRLHLKRLEAER